MATRFRILLLATSALAAVTATSCGSENVSTSGTLERPAEADDAYTYDTKLAPPGAELAVTTWSIRDGTQVELTASGLQPNHGYGAHAHVRPCGEAPDAAGPHFQYRPDPQTPSVDPAYANPLNEIWLDFRTDDQGAGRAIAQVPFEFGDRTPASVVLHERITSTSAGEAGEAGKRVACIDVPFGS